MTHCDDSTLPSQNLWRYLGIAIWCLLIVLVASGASGQPEEIAPEPPTLDVGPPPRELPSDSLQEEQTQTYLKEVITALNAKITLANQQSLWQDDRWHTVLRNHLIALSTWGKFSDVTAWVLSTLGDSARVRQFFFFAMPFLEWMSEPFVVPVDISVPEPDLSHELDHLAQFLQQKQEEGMTVSLTHVGDASLAQEGAKQYAAFYLMVIRNLAARDEIAELDLSLKLSTLVYGFDKLAHINDLHTSLPEETVRKIAEARDALVRLLEAAGEVKGKKVVLRIDMEEYAYKSASLAVFREVVEERPELVRNEDGSLRLGVAIQARLRDSCKDLEGLLDWARKHALRVPVKLVKGAYETYEKELAAQPGGAGSPVWSLQEATDAAFEKLSEFLILNQEHFQSVFATHNLRSIARVMALASSYEVAKSDFEFQMQYGMGDEIKEVLVGMGYRLRVAIPTGSYACALSYAGRHFSELANKGNALARTLRGDTAHLEGLPPAFRSPEDTTDGACIEELVAKSRAAFAEIP